MLRVGIVGFGFMGRTHSRCWKARTDAHVVAICDASTVVREQTQGAPGNLETAEPDLDTAGIDWYGDLEEMLDTAKLDVLSLTLPTCLHAECSELALSQGVGVLCEKPMALNVADCDRMIDAAGRSGKVLQIGHCVRFWPEYAKAKELIDSGRHGRLLAATFRRFAVRPNWSRDDWILDERRSGGMALDLHIHDTDFVQYLCGVPKGVYSQAACTGGGGVVHIATQYLYDSGPVVTAEGGWAMMPGFGFEMSFKLVLEGATICYDLGGDPTLRIFPAEGGQLTPDTEPGDGYTRQIDHFARAVQGKPVELITTLEQSRESVRIVAAEKESARTGRAVSLG